MNDRLFLIAAAVGLLAALGAELVGCWRLASAARGLRRRLDSGEPR